jgi:hypothetical protein
LDLIAGICIEALRTELMVSQVSCQPLNHHILCSRLNMKGVKFYHRFTVSYSIEANREMSVPHLISPPMIVSDAEPLDILQVSNELLFGRSAKECLKLDVHKFNEVIKKETETDLPRDMEISNNFAITVTIDTWKKMHKFLFVPKKKKKSETLSY